MKKGIMFFILIAFLTLLCGCQGPAANDFPESGSSVSDTRSHDRTETIYAFNKPFIEGEGCFEIETLDLPSELNSMKPTVSAVLSETQLLMLLYEEDPVPVIREAGVYDLVSGEYRTSFVLDEGRTISIECTADGLIVYKETDTASNTVSLNCCDWNTGERNRIYQFSPEYAHTSAFYNDIVSGDGKVYFDDVVTEEGKVAGVNLLEYDLAAKEVRLYRKNAQNPLWLDSGLSYICKDENAGQYYVETAGYEDRIYLDGNISLLASAGNELYSLHNESNDPNTNRTIWSIRSLPADEELLLASNAIDQLAANSSVVTWRNFTPEKPVIYLREQDGFTVLLEDELAYNTYLLGAEGGVLICSHDNSPTAYYIFSLT
ncbi:MAG: hypothetical protein DBX44_01970 [Oscillospiraceae bacterium]|nr:MAG: hypothetical protein DBX44_01970 [Oscillospiraceae bacterium]